MKALPIIYLLAALLTWACSDNGAKAGALPVFAWCALLAFGLQWLAFLPAYLYQTEKYYDLTGSLSYIAAILLAMGLAGASDPRSLLLALFVIIWALRLGSFLFARISRDGSDSRFDRIKPDPLRFFVTWSLQGLWVTVTAACALAAITATQAAPLAFYDLAGVGLWTAGFALEVIADRQKRVFRAQHGSDRFINTGLWARSRHPNYCGEILLWCGIALLALPALNGFQYVALVSPLFVYLLLTRISGIPLLEKKSDQRWGDDPAYQQYKANTPELWIKL
jgi:steroid 5-alpha reductase family enzyme